MSSEQDIKFVSPRKEVEIHLSNGEVISGPRGSTLEDCFSILQDGDLAPIMGAIVNGKLTELSYQVMMDVEVHPITMEDSDGMRFYRRSLTFLPSPRCHPNRRSLNYFRGLFLPGVQEITPHN